MNCAEAGQIELEEPNWKERFESHCSRWPRLPRYLQEDSAFEATLGDWRRYHSIQVEVDGKPKRRPAGAVEGMIALAALRIFPPRNLIKDVPRDGRCYQEQYDDHCWIQISGRAWRIVDAADKILVLDSFGEAKTIDLNRARWDGYIQAAIAAMRAAWPLDEDRKSDLK